MKKDYMGSGCGSLSLAERVLSTGYMVRAGHLDTLKGQLESCDKSSPKYPVIEEAVRRLEGVYKSGVMPRPREKGHVRHRAGRLDRY